MRLQQGMIWLAAVLLMPASASAAEAYCVTGIGRGDVLPMRSGPSFFTPVVATIAPRACGIKIVGGCFLGWCPVNYRGRAGWSNATYLVSQTGPDAARAAQRPTTGPAVTRATPPKRRTREVAGEDTPKQVAAAPKRNALSRPVREREPEPEQAAPVAAPRTPVERAPDQKALSVGGAREVCVQGIARGETLRVRAGPSASSDLRYGFLPDTCGVKITGDCKDGWCPVEYRGYRGWAEEKNLQ